MQVRRLVNETPVGQNALVTVLRAGKTIDLSVTPEPASPTQDLLPDELEKRLDEFRRQLPRNQPRWFQGPGAPNRQFEWPLFEWTPGAGRLGVVVQDLSPQLADYFKVKGGVLVASVTPDHQPRAPASRRAT